MTGGAWITDSGGGGACAVRRIRAVAAVGMGGQADRTVIRIARYRVVYAVAYILYTSLYSDDIYRIENRIDRLLGIVARMRA